jgi:hypothetical protein
MSNKNIDPAAIFNPLNLINFKITITKKLTKPDYRKLE